MASKRNIEARKAIEEAWKREQDLVKQGRGTRDWTPEQQRDILENGKAYDDDGRAFEGHHKKNVANYPEYQGNPDNIQFLTRDEHQNAHGGNYQNSTNGEFNPITNETVNYGDSLEPTKIIELSNPIVKINASDEKLEKAEGNGSNVNNKSPPKKDNKTDQPSQLQNMGFKTRVFNFFKKTRDGGLNALEKGAEWWCNFQELHPIGAEIIKAIPTVVVTTITYASKGKKANNSNSIIVADNKSSADISPKVDISGSNASRNDPRPNYVPPGKQRYHYKGPNGEDIVKWKDKPGYPRGGNK